MPSVPEQAKKDYDNSAATYDDYASLPSGQIESQLIKLALGDCTGLAILDLGGGTGVHAREAVDLGARIVDIVDISPGMMKIGEDIERSLGRGGVIRYLEGDVSRPLSHLPLREQGYDVVMANWIFSYAETVERLEGMFRNIVGHLKPGGVFIGTRDADTKDSMRALEKYGVTCSDFEEFPGGVKYHCVLHCNPPVEFDNTSLEVMFSGSTELHERFGLTDVQVVPYERTEAIQKDPEFWKDFLEKPFLAVVKAVKG